MKNPVYRLAPNTIHRLRALASDRLRVTTYNKMMNLPVMAPWPDDMDDAPEQLIQAPVTTAWTENREEMVSAQK